MPQHYFIAPDGAQVLSFTKEKSARAAVAATPGSFYASDAPASLDELPLTLLATLYNIIRPERPIKKFADRDTARKRMDKVLEALATPGTVPEPSPVAGSIAPASEGDATPATPQPKAEPKARTGKLAGHTILRLTETNPRKPGTSGARSWDLVTEGMTVEQFLAAGGVRRDLEWDVDHKWTAVVPTEPETRAVPALEPVVS